MSMKKAWKVILMNDLKKRKCVKLENVGKNDLCTYYFKDVYSTFKEVGIDKVEEIISNGKTRNEIYLKIFDPKGSRDPTKQDHLNLVIDYDKKTVMAVRGTVEW